MWPRLASGRLDRVESPQSLTTTARKFVESQVKNIMRSPKASIVPIFEEN